MYCGHLMTPKLSTASRIVVFGLVPSGPSPPQASYSIDGLLETLPHMASTIQCVPNQQLFNSGDSLGSGPHNLTINVTTANQDQPYILDYLWLCDDNIVLSNGTSSTITTSAHVKLTEDTTIVAAILVTVVLILAIAFYVSLSRIRRKTQQLVLLHGSKSSSTLNAS